MTRANHDMDDSRTEHLGELVELYALGALDEAEIEHVQAHAAHCLPCTQLLGEAERMIAFLNATTIPRVTPPESLGARLALAGEKERRRVFPPQILRLAAIAASLLLVAGGAFGGRNVLQMRAAVIQDDAALGYIANSHFSHASFTKVQPDAPTAKVLWGRSPRWIYVIVDSPGCRCRVVIDTFDGERDLGTPLARDKTATLFVRTNAPVLRIHLRDGTRTLATAQLSK